MTTTRVTHASPAGAYAHSAQRDWESDSNVQSSGFNPSLCRDIAHQLIHEDGKGFNVPRNTNFKVSIAISKTTLMVLLL